MVIYYLCAMRKLLLFITISIFFLFSISCKKENNVQKTIEVTKLSPPLPGLIYHSAYPDFDDSEDQVRRDSIQHFETLAGKPIAWVYFSNNWLPSQGGIHFPSNEVNIIYSAGKTPFIRLMPRSRFEEGSADPIYTMDAFLNGDFDDDLKQWARDAKATNIPLLAEFGTEVNGFWFSWNGVWNGGGTNDAYGDANLYDGPEKFRDVYRKIIDICRSEGANNITWFFHINVENDPVNNWNKMKNYYPGDNYIDWIGISAYGSLELKEPWRNLSEMITDNWNEINSISTIGKPIALLEFGVYESNNSWKKSQWIDEAIHSITYGQVYSGQIKAISYWNESWDDNGNLIDLRLDSSPNAQQTYQSAINSASFISKLKFITKNQSYPK